MPSVLPNRSMPIVSCHHAPALSRACSWPIFRASSSISPNASSAVGWPVDSVPQTVTLRSRAAARSIAALRMPVVTRSRSSGRPSNTALENSVRSRIAQTIENFSSARMTSASSPSGRWNTSISTSLAIGDQSAICIATFW